jgi:hypothetical protein
MEWGGRILMSSTAKDFSHLRAVEQVQQSLQGAPIACAGVELEGKSASIKSSSECIQSSNAISFSSCILRCSAAGSRRQLSIRKNERKGDNDEPHPPLLLERELAEGEVDVVIRKKTEQSGQQLFQRRPPAELCHQTPTATRAAAHPDPQSFHPP